MGRPVTTAPQSLYQDSDNLSTPPFLAKTREHSSQQFLSGSMVSLWLSSNTSPSILVELDELAHHCLQPLHALGPVVFKCTWQIPEDIEIRQEAVIHVQRSAS